MKAIDALKLPREKFDEVVSATITKKPWPHSKPIGDLCTKCGKEITDRNMVTAEWYEPCSVPPKLDRPLEVVARELRDKCDKDKLEKAAFSLISTRIKLRASNDFYFLGNHHFQYEVSTHWYAYDATPEEQIACCLVASGDWEI